MKSQTISIFRPDRKVYVFIKAPHAINLPNQAQIILKAIQENGAITRPALVTKMDERLQTDQYIPTVISHYTHVLKTHGLIKVMSLDEYAAHQRSSGKKEPTVEIVPNEQGGFSIKIGDQMLGNFVTEVDANRTMVTSCLGKLDEKK